MAVGLILKFTGFGKADYDAVNAKLGIDQTTGSGEWPAGMLMHSAGPGDDGEFYVIEGWDSRESQGAFMQQRLGAALQEAGATTPPQMTWIDLVSTHMPGAK